MEHIAFIGTGIMGHPMARNLLRAGYRVHIYTRTPDKARDLVSEGALLAETLGAAVSEATVVITMLPDIPDVRAVYFGVPGMEGVLTLCRPATLLIDMSTVSPQFARDLAEAAVERGCFSLDAPVSGGQEAAERGALSIMVGGPIGAFERAQSLFNVIGSRVVWIGDAGAGQVAKACNQVVVAINIAGVAEALKLAEAQGVDSTRVQEALMGGYAHSRVLEVHGNRMIRRDFKPGFRMRLHLKDLSIVTDIRNVSLPVTSLVKAIVADRVAHGLGDWDHAALFIDNNGEDYGRKRQPEC